MCRLKCRSNSVSQFSNACESLAEQILRRLRFSYGMLIRRVLLLVAVLCWSSCAVSGDTKPGKLTSFRPISQAEYEAILSLTDGKTVVSEGRLINGGLAALAGLTTGWVTSLRLPNIFGSFGSAQKSPNASYPLCVIRTEEAPGSEHHHAYHGHHENHENHEHHEHHSRQRRSDDNDSHESSEHDYHYYAHQHLEQHGGHHHSNEDVSGEHDGSIEMVWNTNKLAPVVNCIVVLREDEQHDNGDHYHHTTTKRPRRKHKKHRPRPILLPVPPPPPPSSYQPPPQYPSQPQPLPPPPPPSPATAYTYSAAQNPYSVGAPPPHGSYNNPWYWQTPQYSPYYSEPPTYAGIYPPAYPDIYATSNPSPYTRNYPVTYPGSFASPPASNNPSPYYDAPTSSYPGSPTSAYPGDSYNPQSSSYTSDYPHREIPLNHENLPSSPEPSYNYGPPPHEDNVEATGQLHYSQRNRENNKISGKSKKSASASKMPTKTNKQKSNHTAKPRPSNDHVDTDSAPTKGPIRRRHTKVKRDESGIQTRSYAKIASYSESGYQPTLYPQNNYQSNYPKVSYTHALPYAAPVYVRNSIDQSTTESKSQQYQPYAVDPENEGRQSGYI